MKNLNLKRYPHEELLFIYNLGFITFLCTVSIISNTLIDNSFDVNFKWFITVILCTPSSFYQKKSLLVKS